MKLCVVKYVVKYKASSSCPNVHSLSVTVLSKVCSRVYGGESEREREREREGERERERWGGWGLFFLRGRKRDLSKASQRGHERRPLSPKQKKKCEKSAHGVFFVEST